MLTDTQAVTIRERYAKFDAWRGNRRSYRHDEIPEGLEVSNDDLSALEVYDFVNNPPDKYFLYVRPAIPTQGIPGKATTWTGDELGVVTFGREWRGNMGDVRVSIRIRAINGRTYAGTYFKSAGDYARVRAVKA